MALLDNYTPATAKTAYFPEGSRQVAALWAREKTLHDWADMGLVQFFEGYATNPTGLSGYSTSKLWLRSEAGVTETVGEIRFYNGGDATLLANWPLLTPIGFMEHIGGLIGATSLDWLSTTPGVAPYRDGSGWTAQSLAALIQLYLDALSTTSGHVPYYNGTDWVGTSLATLVAALPIGAGSQSLRFATYALAVASSPATSVTVINLDGYYAAGDGGHGRWVYAASPPSHSSYFTTAIGRVYVLDEANCYPEMLGAVGSDATKDTAAIQKWAQYPGPKKSLVAGRDYLVNASYNLLPNRIYEGDGSFITGVSGGTWSTLPGPTSAPYVGSCCGTPDLGDAGLLLPAFALDLAPSAVYLDFASSLAGYNIQAGDVIIVYNSTDSSWSGYRSYYRAGEMFVVRTSTLGTGTGSVANGRLFLKGMVRNAITVGASVKAYLVRKARVKINGIAFRSFNDTGAPEALLLRLLTHTRGKGVSFSGADAQSGELDRCYDTKLDLVADNAMPENGNQYGLVISNSTKVEIDATGSSLRHPVAIGGNDGIGCIPNRDIIIRGALHSVGTGASGADCHGNCDNVLFDAAVITNGAALGGRNITARNCHIIGGAFANGAVFYGTEMHSGQFLLDGCILETTGNPGVASRGVIDIGDFNNNSRGDITLRIVNSLLKGPSSATELIRMQSSNTSFGMSVDIDGLHVEGFASASSLIRLDVISGSPVKAKSVSVQRLTGLVSGAVLLTTSGAIIDNTTFMQFPPVGGYVDLATANGVAAVVEAATISYPWVFPGLPISACCLETVGGVTPQLTPGIMPYVYTKTSSQIRHAIATPTGANWASAITVRVNWSLNGKVQGYK